MGVGFLAPVNSMRKGSEKFEFGRFLTLFQDRHTRGESQFFFGIGSLEKDQ